MWCRRVCHLNVMGVALAIEVISFLLFALDLQKAGAGPWQL